VRDEESNADAFIKKLEDKYPHIFDNSEREKEFKGYAVIEYWQY
jgi:hypothetical protein